MGDEASVSVTYNPKTADVVTTGKDVLLRSGHLNQNGRKTRRDNPNIIYGVEERPPWVTVALMGLQHFSLSFSGCFAFPLIVAGPLCFNLDRELVNQLLGTSFFIAGVTTFLQAGFGTRLPIVQGSSAAFLIPAIVVSNLKGPCPPPITTNSTEDERQYVREVAFERMQELQGSICVASLVQFLLGFTGLVGLLLRFIRPITVATTLFLIGLPIITMASDACGTHWGISSLFMFVVILCSQFLDKYQIPLPRGNRLALFTFFPVNKQYTIFFQILIAVVVSWTLCLILTAVGAFPDDPTEYGYKARTDLYNDVIQESTWIRFPYPGQFGIPRVSFAAFLGMVTAVLASMIESVGDYYACALISELPPPPTHAVNRGVAMEGLGCLLGGLWGAPCGYTSYSNNVSAISLTKVASRVTVYFAAGVFVIAGIFYKFNAFCASMPEPVLGGIMGSTFGMVASIGFANLAFIKVNTSRNLFILGFALFLGMGVPDYLVKNPGAINTGVLILDQVLSVILGSNMFLGGLTACILDNLVRGTPEEKGLNWRKEMSGLTDDEAKEGAEDKTSYYDLPFGMKWIRRTYWTRYLPCSPTFTGFRKLHGVL
ncbi:Solute carrier family 23 member 1 [Holothuria leucospilota]|uniref:Solute carrier family 23 member 1 n=1 Tax=Holothuria leucospilota TaxID=206669 RepID=A0A9Q1C6W6_HOLLE|nr:Solute carrier family 23 member 1 [Holothuria leucospilota]